MPGADPHAVPSPRSLPPDLDQLVRHALTQGNVGTLEAALRDHAAVESEPPVAQATRPSHAPAAVARAPIASTPAPQKAPARSQPADVAPAPISVASALATLGEGLDDVRIAWIRGDVNEVRAWARGAIPTLQQVLAQLDREEAGDETQLSLLADAPTESVEVAPSPDPVDAVPSVQEPPPTPTILMPKVRHPLALVVEGMGDVEQGPALAEALGVDAVTARLIAVSRYPRFVLRGQDAVRMDQTAVRIREQMGIRAAVVDRPGMLAIGPAVAVTQAVTATPLQVEVVDRAMWDVDLTAQPGATPREIAPVLRLAVVAEVVVHRFRAAVQGGRLKRLREAKVQSAGEERLGVVDLHTDEGILRVVEGATDLSGFPGHTPSAAVRSLRDFVAHLESMIPVMPRRVCQPGLDRPGGGAVAGQAGPTLDTGWAAFEEHSRACRLLYGLPIPNQVVDGSE